MKVNEPFGETGAYRVHLGRAPELAMLAMAGQALELSCELLWQEHPELMDDERPYWVASGYGVSDLAGVVMRCAALTKEAIRAYGEALCESLDAEQLGRGGG